MRCSFCHGLRGRLVLLIGLALLPGSVVGLYHAWSVMQGSQAAARRALTAELERMQDAFTRNVSLIGPDLDLILDRPVERSQDCASALAVVLRQDPAFTDVGILNADGSAACVLARPGISLTQVDRAWVQTALRKEGQKLALLVDPPRPPNLRLLVLRRLVREPSAGQIVYAAADLTSVLRLDAQMAMDSLLLLVVDAKHRNHVLSTRGQPSWQVHAPAFLPSSTTLQRPDQDVEPHLTLSNGALVGMAGLGERGEAGAISLIVRQSDLYREAWKGLWRSLLIMLLGSMALLVLLHRITTRWIIAPAARLTRAAAALGRGELDARTGMAEGADEFSQVGRAFDRMAGDVQWRINESTRQQATLARLNQLHTVLGEVNEAIIRRKDRGAMMHEICTIACRTAGFSHVWIGEVAPDGATLGVVSWASDQADADWSGFTVRLDPGTTEGQGYSAEVVRTGKPAGSNRFASDPRTVQWHALARELNVASSLILPLGANAQGQRRVLALHSPLEDYFEPAEVALLEQVAQDAALGLSLIDTESRLAHSSSHDSTTGLPNEKLLTQRLRGMLREPAHGGRIVVVAVLDCGIRQVTLELGLQQGNALLRLLGERIAADIGVNDTMGLLPGGRMALVLSDVGTMDQVAKRLQDELERVRAMLPKAVAGHVRVGIAASPVDGEDAEELLDKALAALELAYGENGDSVKFFAHDVNRIVHENRALQKQLQGAIARNELRLHYQPIVSLLSGQLSGFEALLRWTSPTAGEIPPDRFIPLAESSGMIHELGDWLVREAAKQAGMWGRRATGGLFIAINVSAVQLRDIHFAERVGRILDQYYDRKGSIRVAMEVTESHLLKDVEKSILILRQLGTMGIEIILDDFGTGYSSLSYLHRLPLHVLKIDKSFTRYLASDPMSHKMVVGIQALAQSLGLHTVVEGIEDAEQLDAVKLIGCQYVQGFLFDRGLSAQEIESKWLPLASPPPAD